MVYFKITVVLLGFHSPQTIKNYIKKVNANLPTCI
jgi:hypothetical protein